jgi:tRNA(Ile)-lysidine synthase
MADGDRLLKPVAFTPEVSAIADDLLGKCTFPPPGAPVDCAVSGGADSLALMILAVAAGCDVTAIHVDHGIRPGSSSEADVVARAAQRFGAAFRRVAVVVPGGPNLEERARLARKGVLPAEAATGHTMDDQAETMLINLLRGAGTDGLAAMRSGPYHPVLGIRRSDTRGLCDALGLEFVRDPSNLDPRFLRNRVRSELLPLCSELAGRDIVPVLARQAAVIADDSDLLNLLASDIDPTDAAAVRSAPVALGRRTIRQWLRGEGSHPPDLAGVERVLAVARGVYVGAEVAPSTRVRRSKGKLSMSHQLLGPVVSAAEGTITSKAATSKGRHDL